MQQTFRLGKIKGIPIGVHFTWGIAFVLITMSLIGQFGEQHPGWSPVIRSAIGLVTSLLFFTSVILHELAHSAVALSRGIPVKSITLFVFGGISEVTREASTALSEFLIAVVGPLASLAIAGGFALMARSFPAEWTVAVAPCKWLATVNFWLALFNLIPGFPLDGGRVFRSILWAFKRDYEKATRISTTIGKTIAYGFIFLGAWITFGTNDGLVSGLWIVFIGWFLLNAAQQNVVQLDLRNALNGITAGDVMSRECHTVPRYLSLQDFVDDYLLKTGRRCYVVTDDHRVLGIITPREVSAVPRQDWGHVSIHAAMTPLERLKWISPQEPASRVLERMDAENVNQLLVMEDGRLLGLVARDGLLSRIQTFLTFQGKSG
ncbi:MAG: site-2 protease family protein [Acidobacteria bacterium]|nr:site-2 protease family protein [Acidobacteriota bacterium]